MTTANEFAILNAMSADRANRLREIGVRIRTRREELGMTQEELGIQAELSKSRISEIENGASAANGLAYLGIAEGLKKPVEWLLTGEGLSTRAGDPPRISLLLSQIAEENSWSFRLTAEVAAAMNAVYARRTGNGPPAEYTREQILKIAEAFEEKPDS